LIYGIVRFVALALGLFTLLAGWPFPAPELRAQPLRLTGSFSLYSEAYTQRGLQLNRRPGQQIGIQGQITLTVAGQMSFPFSFFLSTEERGYQLPFNQLGFNPRWRWIQTHLGYFSTQLSEWTLRDARIRGVGMELAPGPLRLAFVRGITQRASAADTLRHLPPVLERMLTAIQVGLGKKDGWHLWLTGLHARDTPNELAYTSFDVTPQNNLVVSASVGIVPLSRHLRLKGEVAASIYTPDTWADSLTLGSSLARLRQRLEPLITLRLGSRVDGAASASLFFQPFSAFQLNLEGRYVGPGFRSLGAIQLETDILDVLIAPRIRVRWLQLSGRFGLRRNNLANSRARTRRRTLTAVNVHLSPGRAFSLMGEYTNFGVRLERRLDTLTVSHISHLLGLSPILSWGASHNRHTLSLSYRLQESNEYYIAFQRARQTRNRDVVLSHTVTFGSGHSLTSTGTYTSTAFDTLRTTILNWNESITLQIGRARATLSIGLVRTTTQVTDIGLRGRLNLSLPISTGGQLQFRFHLRTYRYGQPRVHATGYTEGTVYLGYNHQF